MTVYSTKVSAHYIARRAAAQAGGDPVDFLAGTLIVGDGNGSVPSISDLVTHGGVLHEVWRGNVVVAVTVDENNAAQVDIRCVIPASAGVPPVEIGPFWVREFTITDEAGVACVYGTTAVQKTTSAEGQVSDLAIIAAIGESDSSVVILSPPGSNFATLVDVQNAVNAHHPTAEEPLYKVDTTSPSGWLQRLFKIRRADQTQIGVERAATDAEFAAGAPAVGGSPWPWPTLGQIKAALDAIGTEINAIWVAISNLAVTINLEQEYFILPGGIKIQWLTVAGSGHGPYTPTYRIPFDTVVAYVGAVDTANLDGPGSSCFSFGTDPVALDHCELYCSAPAGAPWHARVLAIGK